MKVIYKYPLEVRSCTIDLPLDYKIVCVHEQNGVPTLWIEHDIEKSKTEVTIHIFGTGESIPIDKVEYVGSCFIGRLVWHVYKMFEPNP